MPRLGATYDLRGDGKYRFDATYSEYAGKYSESQFANNTTVGNPRGVFLVYLGPDGEGLDFAPGFDLDNYAAFGANDGTQNVFTDPNISSPIVDEITLSAGMELGRGGFAKVIYTDRSYGNFVEDFVCATAGGVACPGPGDTGTTNVVVEGIEVGEFNNTVFANTDVPSRDYQALQLIGRYRINDNWTVDGNWTHQLKNEGNFEGEGTNTPGSSSLFGDFPGYFTPDRHFPNGTLNDYEQDKIRIWSVYNLGLGRAGNLSIGGLMNYNSGTTDSLTDTIPRSFSAITTAPLAGYLSAPSANQTVFFGERGRIHLGRQHDLRSVPQLHPSDLEGSGCVDQVRHGQRVRRRHPDRGHHQRRRCARWGAGCQWLADSTSRLGSNHLTAGGNADFVNPREYEFTIGFRF